MDYCTWAENVRKQDAAKAVRRDRRIGRVYGARGTRPLIRCVTRGKWWQLWKPITTTVPAPPQPNERKAEWAAKFYMQETV